MPYTPATKPITLTQFKEAALNYRDSNHVNPQAGVPGHEYCLYFSEEPSPSGSHRCFIGQLLHDLGVSEKVDTNVSIASLLRWGGWREPTRIWAAFEPDDLEAICTLATALQGRVDKPAGNPRAWGEVVSWAQARAWLSDSEANSQAES